MTYSAYVTVHNNIMGSHQHIIAQGKTERGMIGELMRYAIRAHRLGRHALYSDSAIVYLWSVDSGVYDVKMLGDYS